MNFQTIILVIFLSFLSISCTEKPDIFEDTMSEISSNKEFGEKGTQAKEPMLKFLIPQQNIVGDLSNSEIENPFFKTLSYTYSQSQFVSTIYFDDTSLNSIPESVWNRTASPNVFGIATKLGTSGEIIFRFWDSAKKRKKGSSSNDLMTIYYNGNTVVLGNANGQVVPSNISVPNSHAGSVGSNKYFKLTAN